MRAWTVIDATGKRALALTTPDGLTIVGDVYGPQGQNLSDALLGVSQPAYQTPLASRPAPSAPAGSAPDALPFVDNNQSAAARDAGAVDDAPTATGTMPSTTATQSEAGISVLTGASPVPTLSAPETGSRPSSGSVTQADNLLKAETVDELLVQAATTAVWFPAAPAKPNAPVIYFLADPTCAHCARATEELAPQVRAGDIDLRIILSPILSRDAVYQAATLIQSDDPGRDFLAHALARFSSAGSQLEVLKPTEINPDVVRGLQRNVEWARTNGVQGVPFWIYDTAEGAKVDFGAVKPEMLEQAIAIPEMQAAQ
ncbi:thioredoxin fold domain-containing protein [Aurantimonas sp. C2-6-R+9]|uniref:DsbA family protein n=1 Tax=unclassified Aurantimonas TaxID=2638230 RepID=UPI002E19696F|nr:thioredoxin fold domain-containing protein [Aurantimonas sp. C2-6-R+9]